MTSNKERSILVVTPAYGGLAYVGYISGLLNLERVCREKNIKIGLNILYQN